MLKDAAANLKARPRVLFFVCVYVCVSISNSNKMSKSATVGKDTNTDTYINLVVLKARKKQTSRLLVITFIIKLYVQSNNFKTFIISIFYLAHYFRQVDSLLS